MAEFQLLPPGSTGVQSHLGESCFLADLWWKGPTHLFQTLGQGYRRERAQAEPRQNLSWSLLRKEQLCQKKVFIKLMCAHVYTRIQVCTLRLGAPPHRADGGVTSAFHYNCRSTGAGRTPGKGCPSGPGGEGSTRDRVSQDRGNSKVGLGSPSLPPPQPRAHLLKDGVPLLGCDNELDALAHVVLKLTGGREEVVGRAVSGLPTLSGVLHCPLKHRLSLVSLAEMLRSVLKVSLIAPPLPEEDTMTQWPSTQT